MLLTYQNLDSETRKHMLSEYEADSSSGKLYISPRLTESGKARYVTLLKEAISVHDDEWLAKKLSEEGLFNETEERIVKGKPVVAKIPIIAHTTLAEGEFNRFYIRGLCARVINARTNKLIVYRAKLVSNPRAESEAKIGTIIEAVSLLADLKKSVGIDTAFGLPPGPNSGLSVKIS